MANPAISSHQPLSLATADGRLRVDFRWHQDRFVHQLFVDGVEAGHSVDGDAADAWPTSPPLQQLSREQINGSPVVLGVGAAGRSHWSISVERVEQGERAALQFDLACRCKDEPAALGSCYQLAESLRLVPIAAAVEIRQGATVHVRPAIETAMPTYRWAYRIEQVLSLERSPEVS